MKANSESNRQCISKLVENVRPSCALQKESQGLVKATLQAVCERVQGDEKSIQVENEVEPTAYTRGKKDTRRLESPNKRKRIVPELVSVPK